MSDIDAVNPVGATAPEAQPLADANSIDSIVDSADPKPEATQDKPEKTPWPKEAENALSRAKGNAARYKQQLQFEAKARADLEARLAQYTKPTTSQATTGEPQEKDFANYHEYIRAVNKYDSEQLLSKQFAERDTKHKETQQSADEQKYYAELAQTTVKQTDEFLANTSDAKQLFDEHDEVMEACPPQIIKVFLESGNAVQATYNLIKLGKLEEVISMSPSRAAIEIGKALASPPPKPQTKAPTPLPASRGSVAGSKSPEGMSGDEIRKWMRS